MHSRSITPFLLCLFAAISLQAQVQTPKHGPTDVYAYHYLALSCVSYTPTGSCQPYEIQRPEPGVTVTLFVTPNDGSGWHSQPAHTIGGGVHAMPSVEFLPNYPAVCVTGADGYCNWFVRGSGWSGLFNIIMIPQDKTLSDGTVLHFPPYQDQYYAGVTVDDKNGNPHTFDPLVAAPYASGTYADTRHLDSQGRVGVNGIPQYNRYGATSCVNAIKKAAYNFYYDSHNGGQNRMAPRRISLPDGGNADNEIDVNGQYLFDPWVVREKGANAFGTSVDIVNPAQFASPPDDGNARIFQYQLMNKMMKKSFIRLSRTKQTGDKIGDGSDTDAYLYWYNQIMNHYVCQTEPTLPQ